jgi:ribosomal protein S18 acetylase RimI-like enzyme
MRSPSQGMQIRPARIDDAPALARVLVDTGRAAHLGQMPDELLMKQPLAEAYAESQRNWEQTLREIAEEADPQECIFVADQAGAVAGLAMGGPARHDPPEPAGEVYVLYVATAHQRRGLGRQLIAAVTAQLARHGMRALRIGCLAANEPARRFYEALGGQVIAERLFDQDGVMLPEVVYGWADMSAWCRKK